MAKSILRVFPQDIETRKKNFSIEFLNFLIFLENCGVDFLLVSAPEKLIPTVQTIANTYSGSIKISYLLTTEDMGSVGVLFSSIEFLSKNKFLFFQTLRFQNKKNIITINEKISSTRSFFYFYPPKNLCSASTEPCFSILTDRVFLPGSDLLHWQYSKQQYNLANFTHLDAD